MPKITDPPPPEVEADLARLRESLDAQVPAKHLDENLLIATWNLRAFGDMTPKWTSAPEDSPKRDMRSVAYIAEVVSRFDIIALQEVKGNLRALRHMLKYLNRHDDNWGFLMSDVTRGKAGNGERMAFVFDRRRAHLSGLAGEVVIPPDWNVEESVLREQFARTPYAVGFRAGTKTFILIAVHIDYATHACAAACSRQTPTDGIDCAVFDCYTGDLHANQQLTPRPSSPLNGDVLKARITVALKFYSGTETTKSESQQAPHHH